ncbi:lytic transglycosylase domain-containing protein [Polymorphobacter megasporae]|uniref:lytic transglycosylase domain-containing protein n=1 Tax=Glacieibacterium megasporae TaxID=2835787 RepID=UPI001C1DE721|nr:lytic transglycosylase domain-containing protein [Polymorphobacter megasporae]UAJ09263.1 lytic transglycosylase domain-containing protein [Polymorphobacter megasporae]
MSETHHRLHRPAAPSTPPGHRSATPASPHAAPHRKHSVSLSHRLSYDEIAALVSANNVSGQPDTLIIAVIYKESRFDPLEKSKVAGSSATGLMQITRTAVTEVDRVDKTKSDFTAMTSGAANIKLATRYLKLRIDRAGGDVAKGLDGYGTGPGYATSIVAANSRLTALSKGGDPMAELAATIGKF